MKVISAFEKEIFSRASEALREEHVLGLKGEEEFENE